MKSEIIRGLVPIAFCVSIVSLALSPLRAEDEVATPKMERVTFEAETAAGHGLGEKTLDGQVLRDLGQNNLIFMDRSGRIWQIPEDRFVEREATDVDFRPFTMDEMAAAMQEELGDSFVIVRTKHYILCAEASREYAQWAGSLFERLLNAFERLWNRKPLEYTDPKFPMCAVILKDESSFQEYAVKDSGSDTLNALGYYSPLTNRMVMYDLTGGSNPRNPLEVQRMLMQQVSNISTVVHEATHQVAFNTNLHQRLAPNPFWLVEGMAMFFETPDMSNRSGWRTVGALNTARLRDFKSYIQTNRKSGALREMLTKDDSFHDSDTALDAYSQAWALSYYLIWVRRSDYLNYLKKISDKEVLSEQTEEERIKDFEDCFGKIEEVESSMMKYLARKAR